MALETIHTLIAKFRGVSIQTIKTILGLPDNVAVKAILIPYIPKYEITVAALKRKVAVVRIFTLKIPNACAWHCLVENFDLFKN